MPSSSIALLFSVAFGVTNALPWPGPQPTIVYRADAWSPAPTVVAADPAKLFKRTSLDVNICGWIGGELSSAAVCSSGSSCIHDTIHGVIGCCTTSGPCTAGVYTSCIDKNSAGWSPNTGLIDNGVFTCPESSVCYQNTYPGGYIQYGCGSSSMGNQVATTFAGQSADMLLQVVFTGVTFSPTSAPQSSSSTTSSSGASSASGTSSTSSASSSSTTGSTVAKVSSNPTSESAGASTTTTVVASKKSNTGSIAGGVIGGLAGLAAIVSLALWCLRRRQNMQKQRRAGSFMSGNDGGSQPATSGPFQRIGRYSPDDFVSASHPSDRGTTTNITAGSEITSYEDFRDQFHEGTITPSEDPFRTPPADSSAFPPAFRDESTPLVSEIDDFSRGFHDAIGHNIPERDTHIHDGDLPGTFEGMGSGGADPLFRSLTNHRTQDRELTSEPFRSGSDGGSITPPTGTPMSPLRSSMMGFVGMASAVTVKHEKPRFLDDRPRYQLVDEVVDDVPILHSPGQLRHERAKRSE